MPRIDAPTVAEHRSRQRAALLAAARWILAERGVEGLTLAAVGASAGLARSSVYQYFDSTAALLAAVVEDAFPAAAAELESAVAAAESAQQQVEAYVETALRLSGDGLHRALAGLGAATLPATCRARIEELHRAQAAPLVAALERLGAPDPRSAAAVVLGLVSSGAHGARRDDVLTLLRAGLPGLAGR